MNQQDKVSLAGRLGNRPVIGTFLGLNTPVTAELAAWTGFELVCIDQEHAPLGLTETEHLIRAAGAAGAGALVRVPAIGTAIQHALDSGADGVLVPRVETQEQAKEAVLAARYPPVGRRGAGPGRASRWGLSFADYVSNANDHVFVAVQIETTAGVEAADSIARVEGVDALFVGPGDLAVSTGSAVGSADHTEIVSSVISAAHAADKVAGIFCWPEDVQTWADRGVRLFLVGSDLSYLSRAYEQARSAVRLGR